MTLPLITWLYCPASRRDRLLKTFDYAPDAVIFDLEDGVDPADRPQARRNLDEALGGLDAASTPLPHIQIRINGIGTDDLADDLALVDELDVVDSVRVPKVSGAEDLDLVAGRLARDLPLHALVETAEGVENLREICSWGRTGGVSLGEADLRTELRLSGNQVIDHIRSTLVIACAASGKPAPVGSAYLNVRDHAGLVADTERLAAQGFLGRTALHPQQLPHIRSAFRPGEDEYRDAQRILDSVRDGSGETGTGAAALPDGTFVDRPIIMRARQVVALWERTAAP